VKFEVLGPLRVTAQNGRTLHLNGFGRRATLGFLLLHANQVVSSSALVEALWADTPPSTARKMLQNNVSALRALLHQDGAANPPALLLTHAPGYLLNIDQNDIDLFRFEQLAETGRASLSRGDRRQGAEALRLALSLWRGQPLSDLVESGVTWAAVRALDDRRYSVWEDCIEAELALGRHQELIGELEVLTTTTPHRERLHGQLMLALYRCGRQVDALAVYHRVRKSVLRASGLEPGSALRHLEMAILQQDPAIMTEGVRELAVRPWHAPGSAGDPATAGPPALAPPFETLPTRDESRLSDLNELSARIGELVAREVIDFLAAQDGSFSRSADTGNCGASGRDRPAAAALVSRPSSATSRLHTRRAS
jgi:DNA-binding SARP family transcriptional activator